jgi:hypothetical protein
VALAFRSLATSGDPTDAASYNVSVASPASDSWLFVDVATEVASGTPNIPGLSGGGLTYNQEATATESTIRRHTRFIARVNTSPGALTLTIDLSAQTQVRCATSVTEVTGGHSGAITQQTLTGTVANATSITVTLAAFGAPDNRVLMSAAKWQGSQVYTQGIGYTELADFIVTGETMRMETINGNTDRDIAPNCSWTSNIGAIAIASELRGVGTPGFTADMSALVGAVSA